MRHVRLTGLALLGGASGMIVLVLGIFAVTLIGAMIRLGPGISAADRINQAADSVDWHAVGAFYGHWIAEVVIWTVLLPFGALGHLLRILT